MGDGGTTELTLNEIHSARPSGVLAALPTGRTVSLPEGCRVRGVTGNFWADFSSTALCSGMRGVFRGMAGVTMLAAYSEFIMVAIIRADAGELTSSVSIGTISSSTALS